MNKINLTQDQRNASKEFTRFLLDKDSKYMVIAGAAGTGKSTLVKHLLNSLQTRLKMFGVLMGEKDKNLQVELTATTNKACAVLTELAGVRAVTVHSRLNLTPRNDFKTGETHYRPGRSFEPIRNSLVIVDEASFINDELFQLIDESTPNSKIILIGDQYQLAPVKQTTPIMNKVAGSRVQLDKIMRHGGAIAEAGARYRNAVKTGVFPELIPDGVNIIHMDGPAFQRAIEDEFADPGYTADKARILAWTNNAVQLYNKHIRKIRRLPKHLCPDDVLTTNKPVIIPNSCGIPTDSDIRLTHVGEPEERYGVSGRSVSIESGSSFASKVFLPDDPTEVQKLMKQLYRDQAFGPYFSVKDDWLDLRPVFASTVHKSQGSTYDNVYINLTDIGRCHIASDVARLLYVAVTRARNKVILYGELPPQYRGKL